MGALVALAVLLVAAVWWLGKVLMPFYVALVLVYLFNPPVTWLARQRVRGRPLGRLASILLLYGSIVLVAWLAAQVVLPRLGAEFARLAQILPGEWKRFEHDLLPGWIIQTQGQLDAWNVPFDVKKALADGLTNFFNGVKDSAGDLVKRAQGLVAGILHVVLGGVLVFMLTGFMLHDLPRFGRWLEGLVPEAYRVGAHGLMRELDRGLAGAVRGQLLVCLVNGVLTTLGLIVLKVKFAVTLGIVAAICSLVPVFGTLVSTIPAVLVGLSNGFLTALAVLGWILLIHLIEANLLNPNIVGHNAELHPALVVLALLVGEYLMGPAGLLVAVPVATIVRTLVAMSLGRWLQGGFAPLPQALALAEAALPHHPEAVKRDPG